MQAPHQLRCPNLARHPRREAHAMTLHDECEGVQRCRRFQTLHKTTSETLTHQQWRESAALDTSGMVGASHGGHVRHGVNRASGRDRRKDSRVCCADGKGARATLLLDCSSAVRRGRRKTPRSQVGCESTAVSCVQLVFSAQQPLRRCITAQTDSSYAIWVLCSAGGALPALWRCTCCGSMRPHTRHARSGRAGRGCPCGTGPEHHNHG